MDVVDGGGERDKVLHVLSAAAFLIFFQSYLVAPLIPALGREFGATEQRVGLLVPAYMLAYAVSTLVYGPLSDRVGRRRVLLILLGAMAVVTAGTATARSVTELIVWRAVAGVATGGIIPIALALLGDLFAYEELGRPMGWIFGAIAGGMAMGSTLGALLNPIVGWRAVMVMIAVASGLTFFLGVRHRALLEGRHERRVVGIRVVARGYGELLFNRRAARTYFYIMMNGIFHSGVFTWLGLYFSERFGLGDRGIGLALLGYGVPGMMMGPVIGRAADRMGRRAIIPAGLFVAAGAGFLLAPHWPLGIAVAAVTVLSLGYDMSHPLLAGIITSIDPARRGQAMALNAFVLFLGFGVGPLIFEGALRWGFYAALAGFSAVLLGLALVGVRVFAGEVGRK